MEANKEPGRETIANVVELLLIDKAMLVAVRSNAATHMGQESGGSYGCGTQCDNVKRS